MAQQLTLGGHAHAGPSPRLLLAARLRVQSLVHNLLHPYRPERHYMRGPGPAWHAKHHRTAVKH